MVENDCCRVSVKPSSKVIPLWLRGKAMPTCPKCGKLISDKKYGRHLRRCGTRHKHPSKPLDHPENFYMKV